MKKNNLLDISFIRSLPPAIQSEPTTATLEKSRC